MRILYFGTYDPAYSRNRVILRGLRENGVTVTECNNQSSGLIKYIKLAFQLFFLRGTSDLVLVGFPGQYSVLLARFFGSAPIVLDMFTSHYEGYVLDRKTVATRSFMAKWYLWVDRMAVKAADVVLLDTQTHINSVVSVLGIRSTKFHYVFVGTDSGIFTPKERGQSDTFVVHFHGNYIPLQGVEYIIKAAHLLKDEQIHFRLVGKGQTYNDNRALAVSLGLKNINFLSRVPYEELPNLIGNSDVCLGIFGTTTKAESVIPNKVYEALACGRAVITAYTPAAREILVHEKNAFLCSAGDPQSLADAIMTLKGDVELRLKISRAGRELFEQKLTERELGKHLVSILDGIRKTK